MSGFKPDVIEKFLPVENEFGLDKSDVVVEDIPLVYHPAQKVDLTRVNQ